MSSRAFDFFDDVARVRRELDQILGEGGSAWSFPFSRVSFLPGRATRAYPLMNIGEDKDNFYVDALAPGLETETLNVSVSGDQLMISGEKKPLPKSAQPELAHRSERSTGQFSRSLTLSTPVESECIEASYTDGVLKIKLPKVEAAKPRQIQVSVG
ncbi:MAG: Hsp20/alpha crystallin family protein [Acidobacteriota bacterium]|jgi:HSP20 family protein|nr:Hsp20/alpha crystallin family protein [Acidobacteriota bacterium]